MKKILFSSIAVSSITMNSFSQWNFSSAINTPVCISANDQKNISMTSDSKGGAIITWVDFRNNLIRSDIFSQRIDASGFVKWTSNGTSICTTAADQTNPSTVEDGIGGVIIAWDDSTNGNKDIFAQRIDSSGNIKWAVNGVPVIVKAGQQKNVKITTDGSGGAIVVWEDSIGGTWDIYAQHINGNGATTWTAGGVAICTAAFTQKGARLIPDGSGGAIIIWQDKRGGFDYDVYAQRINSSGVFQWAANGIVISALTGNQRNGKIVSDGAGGAIIVWEDKRGALAYDVYAQRVNASGVVQWAANGTAVCTADSSQTSIDVTSDNISGAIATWRDKRSGLYHDVYAQKINSTGTMAWAANGIAISNAVNAQTSPNVCADGVGGAIIAWEDSCCNNSWDIKSQRVDANGTAQWAAGGVLIGSAANTQNNVKNISDGGGGSIYAFQDFRSGTNYDIYAHRILSNGTAASVDELDVQSSMFQVFPNPNNGQFTVYSLQFTVYSLEIYNLFGEIVFLQTVDRKQETINISDVPSGLYFYQITADDKQLSTNHVISTGKFMITK
ncbi:MAG: T9SS type A sorting domain-containing protein [Bacteroidetes bacterium]|nr:T9SS type A sorting domain-containing protein [Bacteroidota bacterium]